MLASVQGRRLDSIVKRMLLPSDNDYAEALHRLVALKMGYAATWSGSAAAQRKVLLGLGIDLGTSRLYDGSGLSRADRLTARQLVSVLSLPLDGNHPKLVSLLDSLPVAGRTGTLAPKYLRYTTWPTKCAVGLVEGKTGSLPRSHHAGGLRPRRRRPDQGLRVPRERRPVHADHPPGGRQAGDDGHRLLVERKMPEHVTEAAYDVDRAVEFDRQVATLVDKGYPDLAGRAVADFVALLSPLRATVADLRPSGGPDRIPFVLVVTGRPREQAFARVDLRGKTGFTTMEPDDLARFVPITEAEAPGAQAYVLADIDTGRDTLDVPPEDALPKILQRAGSR